MRINPEFTKGWPIQKLTKEATEEALKKFASNLLESMRETQRIIADRLNKDRDMYLAGMAAAFMDATGCSVEDIQLVIKTLPGRVGAVYYYERKQPKEHDATKKGQEPGCDK